MNQSSLFVSLSPPNLNLRSLSFPLSLRRLDPSLRESSSLSYTGKSYVEQLADSVTADLPDRFREAEGFCVWNGPPFSNGQPTLKLERVSCSNTKFSADGSKIMAMKSDGIISIYDSTSLKEVRLFTIANVTVAELSPCGTYLQTFQKPSTPQEKNVSLWKTETGDLAHSHYQKSITKTTW